MSPNVFEPEFEEPTDRPRFTYRRARIGWQAESERLGASLFEVEPQNACFPYHWHSNNCAIGPLTLRGCGTVRRLAWRCHATPCAGTAPLGQRTPRTRRVDRDSPSAKVLTTNGAPCAKPRPDSKFLSFHDSDAVGYLDDQPNPAET